MGTPLDWAVVVVYFVAIVAFGSYFGRFTKSTRDFFFGGQRFAWWIIAFSLVSTTVGSYSFLKYSTVAFSNGLSSTMSYTNDWFWMPLFMFVWLPIIYFSRITSVPEYFERRFDRRVRMVVTVALVVYLGGYVGINFYTLGKALRAMVGEDAVTIFQAACMVAVVSGIYVTAGGQAAVIMTDLVQGLLLLGAGLALFLLGVHAVGGFGELWSHLPESHRLPLNYFNDPPGFNFVGVLWQDGMSQTMFAYFINQGMMMRFLAAKSPDEGRKAAIFLFFVLMFVAAVAVSGAGWIGSAMVAKGLLRADMPPGRAFVEVAHALAGPGLFGFIMAALTAALMSTADTLINATSAVVVNDVWKLYVRPKASDRHYLAVARVTTVLTILFGLYMVTVFEGWGSIYEAHGTFTAAMTPPVAVCAFCGAFWRRYSAPAALWTLVGGFALMLLSGWIPELIAPFSLGVAQGGDGFSAYKFQRAFFGVATSGALAVIASYVYRPPELASISGLVWGTIDDAIRRFKGAEPNLDDGEKIVLGIDAIAETSPGERRVLGDPDDAFCLIRKPVRLNPADAARLAARDDDLVYLADTHWFLGGLRAVHAYALVDPSVPAGRVAVPRDLLEEGSLTSRAAVVEKIL